MESGKLNPWNRRGIFYIANVRVFRNHQYVGTITKRLDFITYHLIKYFNGEERLIQMGYNLKNWNRYGRR